MTEEVRTLAELNVQPGDVVEAIREGWCREFKYVLQHPEYGIQCLLSVRDGKGYIRIEDAYPLAFRIISRASDTPKTWGEMTDAEKGELLLAAYEGKCLGVGDKPEWCDGPHMDRLFFDSVSYRIKPEPKRETVTLYTGKPSSDCNWGWTADNSSCGRTHLITFDTIDGKPDLSSIKMEKVR